MSRKKNIRKRIKNTKRIIRRSSLNRREEGGRRIHGGGPSTTTDFQGTYCHDLTARPKGSFATEIWRDAIPNPSPSHHSLDTKPVHASLALLSTKVMLDRYSGTLKGMDLVVHATTCYKLVFILPFNPDIRGSSLLPSTFPSSKVQIGAFLKSI